MRNAVRLLVLLLLAGGCRGTGKLPEPGSRLAWPPPPARARIEWIGEIRGPGDAGIRARGLSRLLGLLAGEEATRFHRPYAVAVAGRAEGTGPGGSTPGPQLLAVSDTEARVVHLLDLAEGRAQVLSEVGEGERLASPVGVAFDSRRNLYVSDSILRAVVRYRPDGSFDRILSRSFERPAGIAIDPERARLYVADTAQHIVRWFTLEGAPGGAIREPLRFPTHLHVDSGGRLVVSDSLNFRVLVFRPDLELLASIGQVGDSSGDLQRPKGVASDSKGHLYVVDSLFDNVQIFDLGGRLLLAVGAPGPGPGEFALPAGICSDEADLLYVADSYNGRVQILRYLEEEAP